MNGHLSISPSSATIAEGGTQQFSATATLSDGTSGAVTSAVTWSPSSTNVTINASGLAAAANTTGTVTINATIGGISATAQLTVSTQAAPSPSPSPSPGHLYVIDAGAVPGFVPAGGPQGFGGANILSFAQINSLLGASSITPTATVTGAALGVPNQLVVDTGVRTDTGAANDTGYVTAGSTVLIFNNMSTLNGAVTAAPTATITGFSSAGGIAIDTAGGGTLYVADYGHKGTSDGVIDVFSNIRAPAPVPTVPSAVCPTSTLTTTVPAGLAKPDGMVFDSARNLLFVGLGLGPQTNGLGDSQQAVALWTNARTTAAGGAGPNAVVTFKNVGFDSIAGLAYDTRTDTLYVAQLGDPADPVFFLPAQGQILKFANASTFVSGPAPPATVFAMVQDAFSLSWDPIDSLLYSASSNAIHNAAIPQGISSQGSLLVFNSAGVLTKTIQIPAAMGTGISFGVGTNNCTSGVFFDALHP